MNRIVKTQLLHDATFRMSSIDSHHANSSLVYVGTGHHSSGGTNRPGFVRKYVKVVVTLNSPPIPRSPNTQLLPTEAESSNLHPNRITVYLATINWLDVHPYKDWFGAPVEVWQKPICCLQSNTFLPLTDILCRCAYITKKVRFNRVMEEEITAVVPFLCLIIRV